MIPSAISLEEAALFVALILATARGHGGWWWEFASFAAEPADERRWLTSVSLRHRFTLTGYAAAEMARATVRRAGPVEKVNAHRALAWVCFRAARGLAASRGAL